MPLMNNSISQSAVEFTVLVSFMLIVLIIFFSIISPTVSNIRDDEVQKTASRILEIAYNEIQTAQSANDGYSRNFMMPQAVNSKDYTIKIIDNRELSVTYMGSEYVRFIPSNVSGTIEKGTNKLRKANGNIYLNVE